MEQTGICKRGGGEGEMVERRERMSQRTCMNGPWTWTREGRLTEGVRGGLTAGAGVGWRVDIGKNLMSRI